MSPKFTPFSTNGYAKTEVTKANEPRSKGHLQIIKDTLGKKIGKKGKKK